MGGGKGGRPLDEITLMSKFPTVVLDSRIKDSIRDDIVVTYRRLMTRSDHDRIDRRALRRSKSRHGEDNDEELQAEMEHLSLKEEDADLSDSESEIESPQEHRFRVVGLGFRV